MPRVCFESTLPVPPEELFAWHARPGAFERLAPPWEDVRVVSRRGTVRNGDELTMHLRHGPVRVTWLARHEGYIEGRQFVDVQVRGPFRRWRHLHECLPAENGASCLRDTLDYELPFAPLSRWIAGHAVARKLARMFAFRHERTAGDLALHARHRGSQPRTVGVSAADTQMGRDLAAFLSTGGHRVVALEADGSARDPFLPGDPPAAAPRLDAIVLAQESERALEFSRNGAKVIAVGAANVPGALEAVVVAGPASDDWRARDVVAAMVLEALMAIDPNRRASELDQPRGARG